jgi:hypothetical protein
MLQVLSVTLFEKMPILRAFHPPADQEEKLHVGNQWNLLDL